MRYSRIGILSAVLISGFLFGSVLTSIYFVYVRAQTASPASNIADHDAKMTACVNQVVEATKPPKMNVGVYERIWRICGNQLFNGLYLTDFSIRKEKFLRQELDERVNLWMVVTITLSGVVLAGIQLLLSYRLATQGIGDFAKDSELSIQNRRISLRSSVTGAIILGLSFAFFMVYVLWIYSIREVPVGRPENLQAPSEVSSETEVNREEKSPPTSNRERPSDHTGETKIEPRPGTSEPKTEQK